MTTTEALYFETTLDPKPALELFLSNANIDAEVETETWAGGKGKLAAVHTEVFSAVAKYIPEGSPGARGIHDDFGFWTSVLISFEPRKEVLRPILQDTLIRGALALAQNYDFSLALVFHNGGKIVLKRNARQLTLSSLYDIWTPERLAMVTMPYTMEAIPK